MLERLAGLVPCDAVTYQEADLHAKRFRMVVGVGPDGDADDAIDEEQLYWAVGPCPISDYRDRTGDLAAVRMSDVVSQRRYREMPIFREYFRPAGLEQMIDVGLPTAPQCHRSFILFRQESDREFSERDRAVLDAVQPHFSRFEQVAALRHQLAERARAQDSSAEARPLTQLTTRERQIVELVAEGKTNAQIALELWVAPSTVKKHLENVYEKLGVGRRAAAATWVGLNH
ncbi:MAG: helix-turn-helix transcriptional regulator [Chloroflexota bacterium]